MSSFEVIRKPCFRTLGFQSGLKSLQVSTNQFYSRSDLYITLQELQNSSKLQKHHRPAKLVQQNQLLHTNRLWYSGWTLKALLMLFAKNVSLRRCGTLIWRWRFDIHDDISWKSRVHGKNRTYLFLDISSILRKRTSQIVFDDYTNS